MTAFNQAKTWQMICTDDFIALKDSTGSVIRYGRTVNSGNCPRGVMVKANDCEIVVSEFGLQSRYSVHFRTNTLRKRMNPLILPAII